MRRLTANQLVAYNLRRARLLRGWTQEQAAGRVQKLSSASWTNVTWSTAERSEERFDRVRQFTADDLLAFSLAFDLPIEWFFLPPDASDESGTLVRSNPEGKPGEPGELSAQALVERLFLAASKSAREDLDQRLRALLPDLWDEEFPSGAMGDLAVHARALVLSWMAVAWGEELPDVRQLLVDTAHRTTRLASYFAKAMQVAAEINPQEEPPNPEQVAAEQVHGAISEREDAR